jgi:hypothetical protein
MTDAEEIARDVARDKFSALGNPQYILLTEEQFAAMLAGFIGLLPKVPGGYLTEPKWGK